MNDQNIISAIRAGDETAIAHVMDKYARLLWSIAASVLGPAAAEQDVEECVADVFIHLWQYPEKYDPARGKLKVWLSVLTRTKAIDRWRTLSRQSALPLEETRLFQELGVLEDILAGERSRALEAALDSLEEPDREILLRRYYHDQKPREIARALGLPVKQVDNRLYRTKRRLRELLAIQQEVFDT